MVSPISNPSYRFIPGQQAATPPAFLKPLPPNIKPEFIENLRSLLIYEPHPEFSKNPKTVSDELLMACRNGKEFFVYAAAFTNPELFEDKNKLIEAASNYPHLVDIINNNNPQIDFNTVYLYWLVRRDDSDNLKTFLEHLVATNQIGDLDLNYITKDGPNQGGSILYWLSEYDLENLSIILDYLKPEQISALDFTLEPNDGEGSAMINMIRAVANESAESRFFIDILSHLSDDQIVKGMEKYSISRYLNLLAIPGEVDGTSALASLINRLNSDQLARISKIGLAELALTLLMNEDTRGAEALYSKLPLDMKTRFIEVLFRIASGEKEDLEETSDVEGQFLNEGYYDSFFEEGNFDESKEKLFWQLGQLLEHMSLPGPAEQAYSKIVPTDPLYDQAQLNIAMMLYSGNLSAKHEDIEFGQNETPTQKEDRFLETFRLSSKIVERAPDSQVASKAVKLRNESAISFAEASFPEREKDPEFEKETTEMLSAARIPKRKNALELELEKEITDKLSANDDLGQLLKSIIQNKKHEAEIKELKAKLQEYESQTSGLKRDMKERPEGEPSSKKPRKE